MSGRINLKMASVQVLKPTEVFSGQMKKLRKEYFKESLILRQKKLEQERLSEEKEKARLEAIREDIKAFKQERKALNDIVSGNSSPTSSSFLDPSSSSTSLSDSASSSSIIKKNQSPLQAYIAKRRALRFETQLNTLRSTSENRVSSLRYLYNATPSFITYANMDEKINQVFDVNISLYHQSSSLPFSSGSASGKIPYTMEDASANQKARLRLEALERIMESKQASQ
jgi:hypothetical protein